MNQTKIDYLTHSWNPLAMRCTPAGPGCAHCWHLRLADRFKENPMFPPEVRAAYAGSGPPVLIERRLREPMRKTAPAVIGVQFNGDLFHPNVKTDDIIQVYEVMAASPQHTFVVLTKRPERIAKVLYGEGGGWYLGGGCRII